MIFLFDYSYSFSQRFSNFWLFSWSKFSVLILLKFIWNILIFSDSLRRILKWVLLVFLFFLSFNIEGPLVEIKHRSWWTWIFRIFLRTFLFVWTLVFIRKSVFSLIKPVVFIRWEINCCRVVLYIVSWIISYQSLIVFINLFDNEILRLFSSMWRFFWLHIFLNSYLRSSSKFLIILRTVIAFHFFKVRSLGHIFKSSSAPSFLIIFRYNSHFLLLSLKSLFLDFFNLVLDLLLFSSLLMFLNFILLQRFE